MRNAILLPVIIVMTLLLALAARIPPSGDTGSGYSLPRAQATLNALAKEPRPVGSPGHTKAREWLVARFRSLGLEVTTQKSIGSRQGRPMGIHPGGISVSPMENIIAVLPGRDRAAKAVLVMSHYDSVPYADGASDDAAGVTAAVETATVLSKGQRPLRDTIFLVTDAEEFGLVGAQEFFDLHPMAARVGVVVNAEARGSRGRAIMFQTSKGNTALVDLWAKNAVTPSGNSLTNTIYQRMPNDTDLSVSLAKGIPGINAAYVDGLHDYHMPTDSIASINPASMQQLGNFVLTTARALANSKDLPLVGTSESVYFDIYNLFIVQYPEWAGWLVIGLAVVLLGLGLRGAAKLETNWKRVALGTLGVTALVAASGAASHYLANALYAQGGIEFRDRLNEMDPALWIFIALCLGLMILARPRIAMGIGAVIALLIVGVVAQIMAPGASWLFAWPALAGAVIFALAARKGLQSRPVLLASALLSIFVGGLACSSGIDAYMSIGASTTAVIALIPLFIIALMTPLFATFTHSKTLGSGLLGLTVLGAIWFVSTDRFSNRYPLPADRFHFTDMVTGKSWWATTSGKAELPNGTVSEISPKGFESMQWRAVPAQPIQGTTWPDAPVMTHSVNGNTRTVRITSAPAPRIIILNVKPGSALVDTRLNGKPITLSASKPVRLGWRAEVPDAEFTLQFANTPKGKIDIDYIYALPGMPAAAPPVKGVPTNWMLFNDTRTTSGKMAVEW